MLSRAAKVRFRDENQTTAEEALKDAINKRPLKRAKLPATSDAAAATKKRAALGDLSNTSSILGAALNGAKKSAIETSTTKSAKVTLTISDKENSTKGLNDKERALRSTVAGLTTSLGKTSSTLGLPRATIKGPSATSTVLKAATSSSNLTTSGTSRTLLKAKRATSAVAVKSSTQSTSTRLVASEKIRHTSRDEMEVVLDKSKEEMSEESESESEDEETSAGANKTVIHRTIRSDDTESSEEAAAQQREPRLSTTHLLSNIFAGVDLEEVEDIDADDRDDPLQCIDLVDDIFTVLRQREIKERPNPNYMSLQQSINAKMRGILADWMIDVGSTFTLLSETVFLGVRLMDMFLSRKQVSRERMQLVGIASLVIASKFEEIRSPFIEDWIWISDEAYTRDQILRMEKIMLEVLDFNMGTPTPLHFLRRFSKAARSDAMTHTLSKYLTELSMPEYTMLRFSPSTIAAAAVFLARKMTGKSPTWNKTLQHYTKYAASDLTQCAMMLNELHTSPKEGTDLWFVAVKKKYANEGLLAVSTIPGTTFD